MKVDVTDQEFFGLLDCAAVVFCIFLLAMAYIFFVVKRAKFLHGPPEQPAVSVQADNVVQQVPTISLVEHCREIERLKEAHLGQLQEVEVRRLSAVGELHERFAQEGVAQAAQMREQADQIRDYRTRVSQYITDMEFEHGARSLQAQSIGRGCPWCF